MITGSELHQEKLLTERLEWQQFVANHPFPSRDICISNLHECTARGEDDDEFHYAFIAQDKKREKNDTKATFLW